MERLLVIKPSSFGDIIHGLQVVESYRQQRGGEVHVTWVVRDLFAPFVQACKTVDAVIIYERHGGVQGFRKLLAEIRAEEFDIAIDMQGLARSAAMLWAARANMKIGRRDAREGAQFTYPKKPELPPRGEHAHAVDILREFLPTMGAANELLGKLDFEIEGKTELMRELYTLTPQTWRIVLFPDSRRAEKKWPYFDDLTQRLIGESSDIAVIWAGTEPLKAAGHWPKERFVNLIGKTRIDQLPGLVECAHLVIANDSGPMHLAAAMNKPIGAIFGPTDPKRFGPYPPGEPGRHTLTEVSGDLQNLPSDKVADWVIAQLQEIDGEDRLLTQE